MFFIQVSIIKRPRPSTGRRALSPRGILLGRSPCGFRPHLLPLPSHAPAVEPRQVPSLVTDARGPSGLRIVYIITKASPIGGAQLHVRDLAAAVAARGHAPTVITSGSGTFIDDLRALGIPVIVLRHLTTPIRPLDDLRALREVHAALEGLQPDLIAAHSSKAGILARLAARRLGVPLV